MYELIVKDEFSAAHSLPASGGKCAALHGHNWKVEVRVWADKLDATGMAMDFHDLRRVTGRILEELDHTHLNDHPAFQRDAPTAENLARHIYEGLADLLPSPRVRLGCVRVWESDTTAAAYTQGAFPLFPPLSGKGCPDPG